MFPLLRALLLALALLRSVVATSRCSNYTRGGQGKGGHGDHHEGGHHGSHHEDHEGGHRDHDTSYPGETQEYDLTITWEDHAPDGYSRKMLLVNHQSPGPEIRVDQDDFVVVTVTNKTPYNATIHFHGIEQRGTPWSDGVPGVTQGAILPGGHFRYRWTATQYGSYWYHAHFRGQIEDGLYGPIIIRPRPGDPKPFHLISADTDEQQAMEDAEEAVSVLSIADFTHVTSADKWDMTLKAGFEDSCYDSILFNGKGSVQCLEKGEVVESLSADQKTFLGIVPGASMTDKSCLPPAVMIALGGGQGNPSAFPPGVFSGCKPTKGQTEVIRPHSPDASWIAMDLIGAINFATGVVSIDAHDMWVYAVDGGYVEPQKVQALVLTNGDRYSVLVRLKNDGSYKIRFNSVSAPQMILGHALLSVGGYEVEQAIDAPYVGITGTPLSPDVVFFNESIAAPYPPDAPAPTADALYVLHMKIDGASYLWALNDTRLMPVDVDDDEPVLFQPNPYVHDNVTISTRHNDWIDLVLFASVFPQPPHPIHKHGTRMWLIGSGSGAFRWNSVDEAIKEVPGQFNLVNPPRRDAFATLAAERDTSWVVVRYHASNPGAWLLHCHINNHMMGGMMMVIQDGVDEWPSVPDEYQPGNYGFGDY